MEAIQVPHRIAGLGDRPVIINTNVDISHFMLSSASSLWLGNDCARCWMHANWFLPSASLLTWTVSPGSGWLVMKCLEL